MPDNHMPDKDELSRYRTAFGKLRVDPSKMKTLGLAPHKPILLLSVIQAFEQGLITGNRIHITPELVGLFKTNWNAFVRTGHTMKFVLPFYHMKSAFFWRLEPNPGYELLLGKGSAPSFSNLALAVAYAEIDPELADILTEPVGREILRHTLIESYFPDSKAPQTIDYSEAIRLDSISREILEESPARYKNRVDSLIEELDEESGQIEMFVRGEVFKREVPKIYDYTCCVSGVRIDAVFDVSMVDACHIIPFSKSHDDTITNGISLCPTLHRAFDRGLISLTDRHEVLVSGKFAENSSPYAVRQFEGKTILLPTQEKHHPGRENLEWHRNMVFKW